MENKSLFNQRGCEGLRVHKRTEGQLRNNPEKTLFSKAHKVKEHPPKLKQLLQELETSSVQTPKTSN